MPKLTLPTKPQRRAQRPVFPNPTRQAIANERARVQGCCNSMLNLFRQAGPSTRRAVAQTRVLSIPSQAAVSQLAAVENFCRKHGLDFGLFLAEVAARTVESAGVDSEVLEYYVAMCGRKGGAK